jgi:hypothetical protein
MARVHYNISASQWIGRFAWFGRLGDPAIDALLHASVAGTE